MRRWSIVSDTRLLRVLVLILLSAEKPLSQSAVDAGMTSNLPANIDKSGNVQHAFEVPGTKQLAKSFMRSNVSQRPSFCFMIRLYEAYSDLNSESTSLSGFDFTNASCFAALFKRVRTLSVCKLIDG